MKRLTIYTLVILATLAALFLLWQLRLVLLVFVLSLFVAAAVRPLIKRLTERGLPRALAMILTYLASLVVLGLVVYVISGPLLDEIRALSNRLVITYEVTRPKWLNGSAFQQTVATRLPEPQQLAELLAGQEGQLLAQTLVQTVTALGAVLAGTVLVLVLSIYWSTDQAHFERLWLSLLRPEQRGRARDIWRATETGVGTYLRSEALQSIMAVLLLGAGYLAMGINYPILLALLGGIAWLIPIVGFIFTIIPAFLAGYAISLTIGVTAVLYTVIILLLLELVVEPRVFNYRRLYSPILVVVLLIPLAQAWGLLGFLAAPPLAVTTQTLLTNFLRKRRLQVEAVYPEEKVEALRGKLQEIHGRTRRLGETSPPEVENLVRRLNVLLEETDEALEKELAGLPGQEREQSNI